MKEFILAIPLLLSVNVNAALVTIDADNYTLGTNVTSANAGVSLQTISHVRNSSSLSYNDVYIGAAPTEWYAGDEVVTVKGFGANAFSHPSVAGEGGSIPASEIWFNGHHYDYVASGQVSLNQAPTFLVLGITFNIPTSFVSIRSLASLDSAYMHAYDASGNKIASLIQPLAPNFSAEFHSVGDMEISRSTSDIAFVVIGGGGTANRVNQITYESGLVPQVPIPTAAWLFGSGLLGLVATARKRKAH